MKFSRVLRDKLLETPVIGTVFGRIRHELRSRRRRKRGHDASISNTPEPLKPLSVADWLDARQPATRPMKCFPIPSHGRRISIVTDAVDTAHLFGGVGTSIILATMVANRLRAPLRLITRSVPPDAGACGKVLAANGVELKVPLEVAFAPHRDGRELPVSPDDYFMSTSWWTTRCLLASVRRDRIAYLLQEDERTFYPFGDERLRCEQTLSEPDLFTIVNTELLFDHLATGSDALPGLVDRGLFFEPAFPGVNGHRIHRTLGEKRNLFFYARPNNSRNLFETGIAAIAGAISAGTFSPSEWNVHLVGKDVPNLIFPNGVVPNRVAGLSWTDYQSFVKNMDAGFVLMDTPHPSYPPLDLAAAGAAVLTNSRGTKSDLSRYSDNILMSSCDPTALREGLAKLAIAARNDAVRTANVKKDKICRNWNVALEQTVERIVDRFSNHAIEPRPKLRSILRAA